MALSNIRIEPRREITETILGVVLVGGFLWLDYESALWTQELAGGWREYPWPAGMFCNGLCLALILIGGPLLIHLVGELGCEFLEGVGVRLRPRQRYW
jgi:hypothetical protein